jgi:hypothetical protein
MGSKAHGVPTPARLFLPRLPVGRAGGCPLAYAPGSNLFDCALEEVVMRAVICWILFLGLLLPTFAQCAEKVSAVVRSQGGADTSRAVVVVEDHGWKRKLFWWVVSTVATELGEKLVKSRRAEEGQAPKPTYGYGPENYGPGDETPWWTYEQ